MAHDLLQDGPGCAETRRLALWFATRLDAMWLARRWAYERSLLPINAGRTSKE